MANVSAVYSGACSLITFLHNEHPEPRCMDGPSEFRLISSHNARMDFSNNPDFGQAFLVRRMIRLDFAHPAGCLPSPKQILGTTKSRSKFSKRCSASSLYPPR